MHGYENTLPPTALSKLNSPQLPNLPFLCFWNSITMCLAQDYRKVRRCLVEVGGGWESRLER